MITVLAIGFNSFCGFPQTLKGLVVCRWWWRGVYTLPHPSIRSRNRKVVSLDTSACGFAVLQTASLVLRLRFCGFQFPTRKTARPQLVLRFYGFGVPAKPHVLLVLRFYGFHSLFLLESMTFPWWYSNVAPRFFAPLIRRLAVSSSHPILAAKSLTVTWPF